MLCPIFGHINGFFTNFSACYEFIVFLISIIELQTFVYKFLKDFNVFVFVFLYILTSFF